MSELNVQGQTVSEEEVNKAALFFQQNIKVYKNLLNELNKKPLKRLAYSIVAFPLHDEDERLAVTDDEKKLLDLATALMNAKLIMFSYQAEQQNLKMQETQENQTNNETEKKEENNE